jgi:hypothetical protein
MFLSVFAAVDDESSTPDLGGWRCQYRRKMGRTLWSIEKVTRRDGEQKQRNRIQTRRRSLCSCLASRVPLSAMARRDTPRTPNYSPTNTSPLHLRARPRFILDHRFLRTSMNELEISRPRRHLPSVSLPRCLLRFHASSGHCMCFHALRSCTEKYICIQVTRWKTKRILSTFRGDCAQCC